MIGYKSIMTALLAILAVAPSAPAPQQNLNAQKNIEEIFNTKTNSLASQISGIGLVVTPEPLDDVSTQKVFNSISGKSTSCNCVPYYMCDPSTNSVTEDGSFDGFGVIDIRFNADDPVCPASVDVCCADNKTRNVTLNPKCMYLYITRHQDLS